MPDMPNWQEMGKPVADKGDCDVNCVYDDRYGRYGEYTPHTTLTVASGGVMHNPMPFGGMPAGKEK